MTNTVTMETANFIIIGSGIAGLRAAIELAPHGRLVVLTKSRADESNTEYAQGGIAVAMSDEDEIGLHFEDTIRAGDGLCNEAAVRILVEEGPARIHELIEWGTAFDREGVKLAFTREAAHSRNRILHAHGDSTGKEINRTLIQKVRSFSNVDVLPYSFATRLLIGNKGCEGVAHLEEKTGRLREIIARAVLLATGGLGVAYRETTNPDIATGDGQALAFEAGAALADMEFIQFHPTVLHLKNAPHFLLSEALRGEGAKLRNARGEAFMLRYHPLGDLAPRDVVSRSIFAEVTRNGEENAFLDLRHLDSSFIGRRFPRIYQTCLEYGLDITREWIPVFPAAHYSMGGVFTNSYARTTIPGLFAAGEVACSGVHGANRLASNSLLEGLVYGARAGQAMAGDISEWGIQTGESRYNESWEKRSEDGEHARRKAAIQELMSTSVGIVRSATGLKAALAALNEMSFSGKQSKPEREVDNLLINARLTAQMALLRNESRGGHYRTDFPERNDANWTVRLLARYDKSKNQVLYEAVAVQEADPKFVARRGGSRIVPTVSKPALRRL